MKAWLLFTMVEWVFISLVVGQSVKEDPLLRMPGTQPAQGIALEGPNRCLNCHSNYVDGLEVEPGDGWKGSMMAQGQGGTAPGTHQVRVTGVS